ncbi:MAG: ATP-binding protein [Lachnospiraceae bacterium]|nr:ATP-binding protein [Lachnospiraceae bacterium]
MGLSNEKFAKIEREYEGIRLKNRHEAERRRQYVYENVEGYKDLDESSVSISMEMAKKRLNGEDGTREELHALLTEVVDMKAALLRGAGLPENYLDPIYDCPDCKDTGYIDGERCHCMKERVIRELYQQSNIWEYLEHNNFDNLSYDYYEGENLELFKRGVNACHDLIDNYKDRPRNILFYGTVGTGKSFLSGCVAKEMLDRGYSVIYYSAASLFELEADYTFNHSNYKEELYNPTDYIYNCDVLIIDDLGTELVNSFVASKLFSCINERNLRGKSTIISTNLTLEQLRDTYSERVFSRILSTYTVCKLAGRDIRMLRKLS